MPGTHHYVALFDHAMTFHGVFMVPNELDLQKEYDALVAGNHIHSVAEFAALMGKSKKHVIFVIETRPVQIK